MLHAIAVTVPTDLGVAEAPFQLLLNIAVNIRVYIVEATDQACSCNLDWLLRKCSVGQGWQGHQLSAFVCKADSLLRVIQQPLWRAGHVCRSGVCCAW